MRISGEHDLALGLLLALSDKPRTIHSISMQLHVSISYLEQVARKLREAGLIYACRGPGGGYVLNRPVGEINLGDIFTAVGTGVSKSDFGLFGELFRLTAEIPLAAFQQGATGERHGQ